MSGSKVFESQLDGGIDYEVHVIQGFSGRSEIAVKVAGEVVSVITAEVKRSGNIICRPAKSKAILIKRFPEEEDSDNPPNLDDVIDPDDQEQIDIQDVFE